MAQNTNHYEDLSNAELRFLIRFKDEFSLGSNWHNLSAAEIARALNKDRKNITKMIKKLWEHGYLIKTERNLGSFDGKLKGFIPHPLLSVHRTVNKNGYLGELATEQIEMNRLYMEAYKRKIGIRELIAEKEHHKKMLDEKRAARLANPNLSPEAQKINDEYKKLTDSLHKSYY